MITKSYEVLCSEDPSLIENYYKAIDDQEQTWIIHHRLEIDKNLTAKQLKKQNLYYNRPASELIYLTSSEHIKLHWKYQKELYKRKKSAPIKKKTLKQLTPEMLETMMFYQ